MKETNGVPRMENKPAPPSRMLSYQEYVIQNACNIQHAKLQDTSAHSVLAFNLKQYWGYLQICGFTTKNEGDRDYDDIIGSTEKWVYRSMSYYESKYFSQEVVDNIAEVVDEFVKHYKTGIPRKYAKLYMRWTNQYK